MQFEVNNFAIWTWNVILVSKRCFSENVMCVSENVVFVSEICVLVAEERLVLGNYSFTFGMPLNSGILQPGSTECHFCLRKPFVFRD